MKTTRLATRHARDRRFVIEANGFYVAEAGFTPTKWAAIDFPTLAEARDIARTLAHMNATVRGFADCPN